MQGSLDTQIDVSCGVGVRWAERFTVSGAKISEVNGPSDTEGADRCWQVFALDDDVDIEDRFGCEPWDRRRPDVFDCTDRYSFLRGGPDQSIGITRPPHMAE